jgi:purine nucleosidase
MIKRFVIDTDTASDDAVALVMALRNPNVQIEAITVVAGNVPLDQAVQNTLYTVELCGESVPVYAGTPAPLVHPLGTAQDVHGEDGMGDIGLPLSGRKAADGDAIDVLIDTFRASPGDITLVTIGPLTNLAIALKRAPDLASAIKHCYIMGGTGAGSGNVTPVAEYNFWADPEAAAIVMASSLAKTIIGWDISVISATFDDADAARIRDLGTPFAEFAVDIQGIVNTYAKTTTELAGFDLPDPIAMAVAMNPQIAESVHVHVDVMIGDGPSRGVQSTDWRHLTPNQPNAWVVTSVPRTAFLDALFAGLT